MAIDAELVRQSARAVKVVSVPNVLMAVVTLASLAAMFLNQWNSQRWMEQQLVAMSAVVKEMEDQRVKVTDIHDWCCKVESIRPSTYKQSSRD